MIERSVARLRHHYGVVRTVATKRVIRSFADHYGLVYFGSVSQHKDEHQLIKGITLSAEHKDRHYCVGSLDGYDIILVQRTDALDFPGKPIQHCTWMIVQFDLHVATELPHIFLNAHRYNEAFYANMALKFRLLQPVNEALANEYSRKFLRSYTVYANIGKSPSLPGVITSATASSLSQNFKQFDFEITDDKLFVYASNHITTRSTLNDMIRAGLWLSKELDKTVGEQRT